MRHIMIILYFRLPNFHVSNIALFLHSTSVLQIYIDVALIPSTWFKGGRMIDIISLTDCNIVTPYDDINLGQHWLR